MTRERENCSVVLGYLILDWHSKMAWGRHVPSLRRLTYSKWEEAGGSLWVVAPYVKFFLLPRNHGEALLSSHRVPPGITFPCGLL